MGRVGSFVATQWFRLVGDKRRQTSTKVNQKFVTFFLPYSDRYRIAHELEPCGITTADSSRATGEWQAPAKPPTVTRDIDQVLSIDGAGDASLHRG